MSRRDAQRWLEAAVRLGYLARALLYVVVALAAIAVAAGQGGQTEDTSGAMRSLSQRPFGGALLLVIAVGLAGYAVWRAWQAIAFTEDVSTVEMLAKRTYRAGRAVLYGLLAWTAGSIAVGAVGGDDDRESTLLEAVLALPGGRILGVGVGVGVLVFAGAQGYRAATRAFEDQFPMRRLPADRRRTVAIVGALGYWARCVVFGIVGVFVVVAAWEFDPERARGFDEALAEVSRRPYGPWLLGTVALGLLAFGLYSAAQARYREIEVDG